MGHNNKKSSKEPKKYLKRHGAPFTPESSTRLSPCLKKYLKRKGSPFTPELSTRKSPRLLLSKQLSTTSQRRMPMTQVQIPNYFLPNYLHLHLQLLLIFYWMTILKDPTGLLRNRDGLPRIRGKEMLQLLPNILRSMAHTIE